MFSTANTFTLTLPDNSDLVFSPDLTATDWAGVVGSAGVTSSVELRESRSQIARADGEVIGNSYWGGRSIVIDVFVPITDPAERGDILTRLQQVVSLTRANGVLSWTETDTAETAKSVPVRLQSFPTIGHTDSPTKTYQIVLTAMQPHIDGSDIQEEGPEDDAVEMTITNDGNFDAYPVIRLDGPFDDCIVENETTGEALQFDGASVAVGEWLEIYCRPDQRQVLFTDDGSTYVNYYDKLVIGSTFPAIVPGANTFEMKSVTAGDTTTKITITWKHAWL
jgi:hypothetical protein